MPTHTRIRPFNTRETYPEQNLDNDLCQAVIAGGVVYLRGQIGQDLDTRESVGIGDVEAQAEKAMANIAELLEEAGSSLADIVKVVVYLIDPRYRETVYGVMGRWLKGVHPVSTGLVVSALARPEWPRSSGRPDSLSTTAGCRSPRSTSRAGRSTSAASPPSRACTSSDSPGSRDAGRASSGGCGTTRSTSPTRSRSSDAISPTAIPMRHPRRSPKTP